MCLRPEPIGSVPEETARVARAAFPKGNIYMQMRDVLGAIYDDASFAALFAPQGQPAQTPWRLALVTVMQFAEGLSDRQAADAVRGRIDWKYALGLELTDPGFDFSLLSEFRARLIDGSAENLLLNALLTACRTKGYLKERGRQRTDSTHVLGALRLLSRLELVAESLRHALNVLAAVAPEWVRDQAPPTWFERYGRRVEDYRLPRGKEAREVYAQVVGADGRVLLTAVYAPGAPADLRALPAVQLLRSIWLQQFVMVDDQIHLREPKDLPPAHLQICSPVETEVRYSVKRDQDWVGYKVHLTETCDEDSPHLLTQVETTVATVPDVLALAGIQEGLAAVELLPNEQLVDGGYVRAQNVVDSRTKHEIDLVGPIATDHTWQAKAEAGFDVAHFAVDWERHVVTCPQGHQSIRWCVTTTARARTMVHVDFAKEDCAVCPVREQCTRAKDLPRSLTLLSEAEHQTLRVARERQQTEDFKVLYAQRAGIEGTIAQGVRAFELRQARYRGLARTHVQHIATAAAVNLIRLADWLNGVPRATTRTSRFAALAVTAYP
jgi:transposase